MQIEAAWKINQFDSLYHVDIQWNCSCGKRNRHELAVEKELDGVVLKCIFCHQCHDIIPYQHRN